MKKLWFVTLFSMFLLLMFSSAQARVLNAIAIVVDGEPITTAEIQAVQDQLRMTRKEAQEMLIESRLEKAAMRDIVITEEEIDTRIKRIAEQNNITVAKMQEMLAAEGESWYTFRDQIKTTLQKQKFFRTHIAKTIQPPTDDTLRLYYANHAERFSAPSRVRAIEYRATKADILHALIDTPAGQMRPADIEERTVEFTGKTLNPRLLAVVASTQSGAFTPVFNDGASYLTYQILEKGEAALLPFESVRESVMREWENQEREEAVKNYFKKQKSEADIEYLRP
jgi:parvulin-like peptidyl-prolyl isomerase